MLTFNDVISNNKIQYRGEDRTQGYFQPTLDCLQPYAVANHESPYWKLYGYVTQYSPKDPNNVILICPLDATRCLVLDLQKADLERIN